MSVIEFLQGLFGEQWLIFFRTVTRLGDGDIYLVLLSLYYWLVDPQRGRQLSLLLTLSVMSNILLKQAFGMPRPYIVNPAVITPEASHTSPYASFPSGHAQGVTTFWGAIAYLHQQRWLWLVAITMIVLVCTSRLYLGVHFPVDVAGGILLGLLWISLGIWAGRGEQLPNYQLWQRVSLWGLGGCAAIAVPNLSDLIGVFLVFLPVSTVQFVPPSTFRSKLMLGTMGLGIVMVSYAALKMVAAPLPDFALIDYLRAVAIALIVTEGIPRLWQRLQPLR